MTTQPEAMKLALEALEGLEALLLSMGLTHLIVYGDAEKAITNLQKAPANEALDKMAENARELGLDYEPAQQEPYGWKVYGVNSLFMGEFAEADAKAEAKRIGGTCTTFPLYTSPQPPQRTWVGLTDAEKLLASQVWRVMEPDGFIKAIEANLKQKNGYAEEKNA